MKIAARLKFIVALPVILAITAGAVELWSSKEIDRLEGYRKHANDIVQGVFGLTVLTLEYASNPALERIRVQWSSRHRSLGELLESVQGIPAEAGAVVHSLRTNHEAIGRLFGELSTSTAANSERIKRLNGQLVAKSQIMVGAAARVEGTMAEMVRSARRRESGVLLILLLTTAAAVALSGFLVGRALLGRLSSLEEGMAVVGSGNLQHRLNLPGHDELNELANAFDRMSERLQSTREDLEQEVEERKRTEAVLKRTTRKLSDSNQQLEQFAYIASHDLQEPLRMVASYLQLIEHKYRDKLDDEGRDFIGFAVDGAKRMKGLINGLLTYSRVDSQGGSFEPTAMEEVLGNTMHDLAIVIEESRGTLSYDVLPTVVADRNQMHQLFQNLIANAIKFRDDMAPEVHISARRLGETAPPLPESVAGYGWLFSVRDNGIGIEPQHAERIFKVFQRLHGKSEYEGTGIGLAVCQRIVERHGGRIWVESVPGKGSTFYFTIPERPAEAEPHE